MYLTCCDGIKKEHRQLVKDVLEYKEVQGIVFYNRFYNINKMLGFDKFFSCLGTIVRQYKHLWMFVIF